MVSCSKIGSFFDFFLFSSKKYVLLRQYLLTNNNQIMHHLISSLLRIAYAAGFGFILLFHAEHIVNYIPQLLGSVLMLEVVAQVLELFYLKLKTHVSWWYFLVPGLIFIYGLVLIFFCRSQFTDKTSLSEAFNPENGFSWTTFELQLGGICFLAFLLSELVISFMFRKPLYSPAKFAEESKASVSEIAE